MLNRLVLLQILVQNVCHRMRPPTWCLIKWWCEYRPSTWWKLGRNASTYILDSPLSSTLSLCMLIKHFCVKHTEKLASLSQWETRNSSTESQPFLNSLCVEIIKSRVQTVTLQHYTIPYSAAESLNTLKPISHPFLNGLSWNFARWLSRWKASSLSPNQWPCRPAVFHTAL